MLLDRTFSPSSPLPLEPPRNSFYSPTSQPISFSKEPAGIDQITTAAPGVQISAACDPNSPRQNVDILFETPTGALNFTHPFSSEELWESSLSGFFDLYSLKSGVSPTSFTALKFITAFGSSQEQIIRRDESAAAWKKLKGRLSILLELKRKDPEIDFEIWVKWKDLGA